MALPIYRAKKIDSDEWVEGYLLDKNKIVSEVSDDYECLGSVNASTVDYFDIDQNTLAIHFPNMLDKNGKKIFASLSEDGVGRNKEDGIFGFRHAFHKEIIGIHKGE